jgi:hypothetical protein
MQSKDSSGFADRNDGFCFILPILFCCQNLLATGNTDMNLELGIENRLGAVISNKSEPSLRAREERGNL